MFRIVRGQWKLERACMMRGDTVKSSLERLESLGDRENHQQPLEGLQQVLGVAILSHEFNPKI
jgi:hypothetical protein